MIIPAEQRGTEQEMKTLERLYPKCISPWHYPNNKQYPKERKLTIVEWTPLGEVGQPPGQRWLIHARDQQGHLEYLYFGDDIVYLYKE